MPTLLRFMLSLLSCLAVFQAQAALFIKAPSGQWFYVEEHLETSWLLDPQDRSPLAKGQYKRCPPPPGQALDTLPIFVLEPRLNAQGQWDLWAVGAKESQLVCGLDAEYLPLLSQKTLYAYKAYRHELALRQTEQGTYMLWDLSRDIKLFDIKDHAAERYKQRPELLESMGFSP